MKKILFAATGLLALTACQNIGQPHQSDTAHNHAAEPYSVAQYSCNNKALTFSSAMTDGIVKGSIQIDQVVIPMHQETAASGLRMVADDKYDSTEFHTKGKDGVLSYKDAQGRQIDISCRMPG